MLQGHSHDGVGAGRLSIGSSFAGRSILLTSLEHIHNFVYIRAFVLFDIC